MLSIRRYRRKKKEDSEGYWDFEVRVFYFIMLSIRRYRRKKKEDSEDYWDFEVRVFYFIMLSICIEERRKKIRKATGILRYAFSILFNTQFCRFLTQAGNQEATTIVHYNITEKKKYDFTSYK
ncbi:hypothetical protein Glove_174g174 [Diversispora epigaea]|uniref:Uncharacterized protein n=1 Tax=Diversispora epigaea TaxID=1348612 RepID=A0A397IV54_9GLOM|nr:hypothetical protein Glove_174g174 [Diversispora epigaea]